MSALNVGDKIRILVDGWDFAAVEAGDILEVEKIEDGFVGQIFSADGWWFGSEDEGKGWERYEGEAE